VTAGSGAVATATGWIAGVTVGTGGVGAVAGGLHTYAFWGGCYPLHVPRSKRFTRNLGRLQVEPLPVRRPDARYIRFEHPSERFGVFSYVSDARKEVGREDRAELKVLMDWFNEHLDAPYRMVPFRPVGRRAHRFRWTETTAICWFREEAFEHLLRARRLAAIVRSAGIPIVERSVTRIPGKLCSEDAVQIAVEAYRDA
jgi:hypothetical protein